MTLSLDIQLEGNAAHKRSSFVSAGHMWGHHRQSTLRSTLQYAVVYAIQAGLAGLVFLTECGKLDKMDLPE